MCFHKSRYIDEDAEQIQGRRVWDLFYRETERSEPPLPVVEHDEELVSEDDRVPVGDHERGG